MQSKVNEDSKKLKDSINESVADLKMQVYTVKILMFCH